MIPRAIHLQDYLEKNKVLVLYGPRQVGKTTLVKEYLHGCKQQYKYYSGDDISFSFDFGQCILQTIRDYVGDCKLFVIDEAQKVPNIGRALKLLVDNIDGVSVIVTGSSSFDLANKTGEALTGRKNIITLFPVAQSELLAIGTPKAVQENLGDFLIYGTYPDVVTLKGKNKKGERIKEITHAYLLKDILEFDKVKNPRILLDLLKLLSFQIGSEVSTSELGGSLGIDAKTVSRYLDLLEKSFVLVRFNGYSRNLRKEVRKMSKYFFYDLGIRNALVSNFNALNNRDDIGKLWENFLIIERLKRNAYKHVAVNYYFWRTYEQKEIDLIEERGGKLYGYECKWDKYRTAKNHEWLMTYPNSHLEVISRSNYLSFLT